MSLLDVVKLSLSRYRVNPAIVVPPLVSMIVYQLSILWRPIYPEAYTNDYQSFLLVGLGMWVLIQAVSFSALLGQASMAGKAVSGERTSLGDWVEGVRAYFSRVFGISLIYLVIAGVFFIPLSRIYYSIVLLPLASQMGITAPQTPPPTTTTPLPTAILLTIAFFITTATAVFYMLIAPVVFENKGVISSLRSGTTAIRRSGWTFLGFIALMSVISGVTSMIENLPMYSATEVQRILHQGYLKPLNIASQAINTVISPLWFLIAFTIYHDLQP